MIFRESRILKSFIARLMFGIYFFALFSSSFHSHDSADIFIGFNFKKSENTISKNLAKEKAGDCLACHFLATGNTLFPEEFTFHFENHTHDVKQIIAVQERVWSHIKFTFQLRGPPTIS